MQQKCPLALALAPKLGSRSRYLTGKLAKAETKAAPPMADTSGAAKPSAAFLVRVRVRVRASDQPNPNPNPNQHHEQESTSQAPVVQPLNIRSIQSLDHCMSFWHVLEWLQESFLTRGTIMYSWIAQKRSLGFLVKNASDTSKRQKIPLRGLQVPLWGHL